ncbi:hypothetical protein ABE205_05245 [Brevibacillus agri]|uniref:hypothetical protein n=1 Tax=Brevibacillus agri TaxID=51101 RepID=UPI003D1F8A9C
MWERTGVEQAYELLLQAQYQLKEWMKERNPVENPCSFQPMLEPLEDHCFRLVYPELAPVFSRLKNHAPGLREQIKQEWLVGTEEALRAFWQPDRRKAWDGFNTRDGVGSYYFQEPVAVWIRNHYPANLLIDLDNHVYKWMIDALVNAYFIPDDNKSRVSLLFDYEPNVDHPHTEMYVLPRRKLMDFLAV